MKNEIEGGRVEAREVSTLRIVAKREDKEPYTVNIPVREARFH